MDFYPSSIAFQNCRLLISKINNVKLAKINRSQNKCADKLAKHATVQGGLSRTFLSPPPFVQQHFFNDYCNSKDFCLLVLIGSSRANCNVYLVLIYTISLFYQKKNNSKEIIFFQLFSFSLKFSFSFLSFFSACNQFSNLLTLICQLVLL